MIDWQTFEQIDKLVVSKLPKDYRRVYVRPSSQMAPYIAIIGGSELKTRFILTRPPNENLTEEEHEFANWCLTHGSAAWCCVRSISDAEAALKHWGFL